MQICSIRLRNFKAHRERQFDFQAGVNAICGENGAGKTSILEAIAWTLFDFNGGYTKDELRRLDAASASVTVSLISARDGRVYQVQRQTFKSRPDTYEIYDPQLGARLENLNRIQDAQVWLREHLGFSASTDLSRFFAEVIGIPQGMFTADFLRPARDRRKVFDPILKLESYRQAYEKATSLQTYTTAQVEQLTHQIAQLQQQIQDQAALADQLAMAAQQLAADQQQLKRLTSHLNTLQQQRAQLQAVLQALQALEQQRQQLFQRHQTLQVRQEDAQRSLAEAEVAASRCRKCAAGYEEFRRLEQELQKLSEQLRQREMLRRQLHPLELAGREAELEILRLREQLADLDRRQAKLKDLTLQVKQQEELETALQQILLQCQQQTTLQEQLSLLEQQWQTADRHNQDLNEQLNRLRQLQSQLPEAEALHTAVQSLRAQLERQRVSQTLCQQLELELHQGSETLIQQQQAVVAAQQLIVELQAGLPLYQGALQQIHDTLEAGYAQLLHRQQTLVELLKALGGEDSPQQLQTLLKQREAEWRELQRQQLEVVRIGDLAAEQDRLRASQDELTRRIKVQRDQLQSLTLNTQAMDEVKARLASLGDPRSQWRSLQEALQQRADFEQQLQAQEAAQQTHHQQRAILQQQLAALADLDQRQGNLEAQRQNVHEDYQTYLQHQRQANNLEPCKAALGQLSQQLGETAAQLKTLQTDWEQQQQQQPAEHLATLETEYQQQRSELDRLSGSLPLQEQHVARLQADLQAQRAIAQEISDLEVELAQRQRLQQFVSDARRIFNQSGPRIARYFVEEISREADRLYRELLNRSSVALRWSEDYEIQVQEGGRWRNFKTLSGGEQMCAALAVRLSLLRVIGGIDVVFFDEPTTNMDGPRRRQLAEALGNLRSFRQLFVISHDDTFENVTEHVIRVEREAIA
jgi:DNA repair protein SbcC/Rad50